VRLDEPLTDPFMLAVNIGETAIENAAEALLETELEDAADEDREGLTESERLAELERLALPLDDTEAIVDWLLLMVADVLVEGLIDADADVLPVTEAVLLALVEELMDVERDGESVCDTLTVVEAETLGVMLNDPLVEAESNNEGVLVYVDV
jgi:hypothetical protein